MENTGNKLEFIYIEPYREDWLPKGSFYAMKLSNKDKEKLYPNWTDEEIKKTQVLRPKYHDYADNDNEMFVYGLGYKKLGKTNKVEVPVFSGNIDEWDDYLEKYGKECLFYSLTGVDLHDWNCSYSNMQTEFLSLLQMYDIHKYQEYVKRIKRIQEIQRQAMTEKLTPLKYDFQVKDTIDKCLFRPSMRIMLFITSPYMDTPADDDKTERYYRTYRHEELERSHPKYQEMQDLIERRERLYDKDRWCQSAEYEEIAANVQAINKEIMDYVVDTLAQEIDTDNGRFPVSLKDRIGYLFGEECQQLYESILNDFKL